MGQAACGGQERSQRQDLDDDWSDEEEPFQYQLPDWSLQAAQKAPLKTLSKADPMQEQHPQHQRTFFCFLRNTWANTRAVPRYPVLQPSDIGQEAAFALGRFEYAKARHNWSKVHNSVLNVLHVEEHWVDREFSEHVESALGYALTEKVAANSEAQGVAAEHEPNDPRYAAFFDRNLQSNNAKIPELLENIRLTLPASSEILIIAVWYLDMLVLANPDFGVWDSRCINCVLILCTLLASKTYDAGVRMLKWGDHNQSWARCFKMPNARLTQMEILLVQLLEWNVRMPLPAFVHYRYELTRGSIWRGLLHVVECGDVLRTSKDQSDVEADGADCNSVVQLEVKLGEYAEPVPDGMSVKLGGDGRVDLSFFCDCCETRGG